MSQIPICVECQVLYKVKSNGVTVNADNNKHYDIRHTDLAECPHCGHRILYNHARDKIYNPVFEESDYYVNY